MDPRLNPYTPNAGAIPPVLVGRQDEMEAFEVLLDRLRAGRTEQSMIITGLRGVGKTVLLTEFGRIAADRDWVAIEMEIAKHDDNRFRLELARECRRALLSVAPRQRWGERARRAAQVLRSFSLGVDPDGRLTADSRSTLWRDTATAVSSTPTCRTSWSAWARPPQSKALE